MLCNFEGEDDAVELQDCRQTFYWGSYYGLQVLRGVQRASSSRNSSFQQRHLLQKFMPKPVVQKDLEILFGVNPQPLERFGVFRPPIMSNRCVSKTPLDFTREVSFGSYSENKILRFHRKVAWRLGEKKISKI